MFIISNINSGIKSSLKKLDKPIIKINKLIKAKVFSQISDNNSSNAIKHAISSSKKSAILTPANKFIQSLFNKNSSLENSFIQDYLKKYDEKAKPIL